MPPAPKETLGAPCGKWPFRAEPGCGRACSVRALSSAARAAVAQSGSADRMVGGVCGSPEQLLGVGHGAAKLLRGFPRMRTRAWRRRRPTARTVVDRMVGNMWFASQAMLRPSSCAAARSAREKWECTGGGGQAAAAHACAHAATNLGCGRDHCGGAGGCGHYPLHSRVRSRSSRRCAVAPTQLSGSGWSEAFPRFDGCLREQPVGSPAAFGIGAGWR